MPDKMQPVTLLDAVIDLPFCKLGLHFNNHCLHSSEYMPADEKAYHSNDALTTSVINQLHAYCEDPQYRFNLQLEMTGTEFQQRVWRMLVKIPAGKVLTYGELAKRLSSSPRAVGSACRANPLPLLVPCHRVVSATGLGGFAGASDGYLIEIKRQLLQHEGLVF